jgi:hypothetical protein
MVVRQEQHRSTLQSKVEEMNVELPDLSRIVDTYVPISATSQSAYLNQLRQDVLPHIRRLQADGHLRWFSFLLHDAQQLGGREPVGDGRLFIHLRLERATDLDLKTFMELLPSHFLKPIPVSLLPIGDFDVSTFRDNNAAYAWKILGDCSEWTLCLLEGYKEGPSRQHIVQFLHYITNPLMMGLQCIDRSTGSVF